MADIDLRPFGISHTFSADADIPYEVSVAKATNNEDMLTLFDLSGSKICSCQIRELLGSGTSGTTYALKGQVLGFDAVVKVMDCCKFSVYNPVVEALMQIIVMNATEEPLCPRFLYFAKDDNYYYLISERMTFCLKKMIDANTDINILCEIIVCVASILEQLMSVLNFNHRDLKLDNIMFDTNFNIRLIDFGTCCLIYGRRHIEPGYFIIRDLMGNWKSPSRDMKAFFYYLLNHSKYQTRNCPFKRVLNALICSGKGYIELEWLETYKAFDVEPDLPNLSPQTINKIFTNIKFSDSDEYAKFEPSWVLDLSELNDGLLRLLKSSELNLLPKERLLGYLKARPCASLFYYLSGRLNNAEIKEYCRKALEDGKLLLAESV